MSGSRRSLLLARRPPSFWSADHSLTIFLALTLLFVFVALPIHRPGGPAEIVMEITFALVLVSGTLRVAQSKHVAALAIGLVVVTLAMRWLRLLEIIAGTESVDTMLIIVLLALMAVVLLISVFRPGSIDTDRILGAVAVYMLLVLMWANLYLLLDVLLPGALQLPDTGSTAAPRLWSMLYVSLSTATTVGYGNATTAHPLAQSLTNSGRVTSLPRY